MILIHSHRNIVGNKTIKRPYKLHYFRNIHINFTITPVRIYIFVEHQ